MGNHAQLDNNYIRGRECGFELKTWMLGGDLLGYWASETDVRLTTP